MQVRRLVRDPYTRLGGVASGIAHHYGIDVSIVRILFILLTFASGVGLLAYLIGWLVIPRAEYWPPPGPPRSIQSLSGRDLGLGLALVGLMVALGFGAGTTGAVLVPVILIGGGIWLLAQPRSEVDDPATTSPGEHGGGMSTPPPPPPPPAGFASPQPGAPVPPRSRRRVAALVGAAAVVVLAIPLLIIGALITGVATGNITIDDTDTVRYVPTSAADVPRRVSETAAHVIIDLTQLEAADFDDRIGPVALDARVDFGEITVLVPDELTVSVDANVDLGEVRVFGQTDDGFDNTVSVAAADPDIDLELDLDVGQITVERG